MAFFLCAAPVVAAEYSFSFVTNQPLFGGPVDGSGIFTTSDTPMTVGGETAFAVTSITGMVNGSAIAAPTGNYGNYFTTGGTFLDGSGLRFFTAAGNDIRFFFQDSVGRYRVNTFSPGSSSFVTAMSAPVLGAVPEPGTWATMILGFGAIGLSLRRSRQPSMVRARA
ncbi:PEPxxWA-CTERM sorting domain-containing protein [Sandaracinobacteroides saxicola]|nr:PEPxxWA-CTERM sorting domain-containing protein [Sandaracinobacteroides saxicola]